MISISANHSIAGQLYTDWRLPTKHELNLLYLQKDVVGVSIVPAAANFYWSSTAYTYQNSWGQYFDTGIQSEVPPVYGYYVRAIRSF